MFEAVKLVCIGGYTFYYFNKGHCHTISIHAHRLLSKRYPSRRAQESFYSRTDQPSSTAGSSLLYIYTISTINQPRLCIWSKLGSSFNQSINFDEVIERTLYALCIHSNQALFSTKPMVCIPSTLLSYPWQQLKILGAVSC